MDIEKVFQLKTASHILKLREASPGQTIFGGSDVMKVIDIQAFRASDLLKEMAEHVIIERESYNKAKSESSKQPGCPEEKLKAIEDAMEHFQMVDKNNTREKEAL